MTGVVLLPRKPKLYIGWTGEDDSRTIDCQLPFKARRSLSGVPVRPPHGNALEASRGGSQGKVAVHG